MNRVPFGASEQLSRALAALGAPQPVVAGQYLFKRCERARGVYLVESGKVELALEEGVRELSRICGPGSLLGLPSSMTGNDYSMSAQVLEPSVVRFIPRAEFLDFLRVSTDLCVEVLEVLATEVRHARHQCA